MGLSRQDRDALVLFAVCVVGFGLAAWAALSGLSASFDRALLIGLRTPGALADPIGPPWFEEAARDVTGLGGTPILILATLVIAIHLLTLRRGRLALFAVLTIAGAQAVSEGLKALFERPRPDLTTHEVAVYSASLPSGHAMLSAAALFTLAFALSRAASNDRERKFFYTIAGLFTILIGLSRLYLGVHWPTDVLAGWFAGLAWASAGAMIYRRLAPQT